MRIGLAFSAFFAVLGNKAKAERVAVALQGGKLLPDGVTTPPAKDSTENKGADATAASSANKPSSTKSSKPVRSDALTLLTTLQREARFLDLVKEPLDQYQDAEVGAAARDVLRDCNKVIERLFEVRPLLTTSEGSQVDLPDPVSPVRYRLVGGSNSAAKKGTLVHPGWQASKSQLPEWTGIPVDAMVLAPAEVEVKN